MAAGAPIEFLSSRHFAITTSVTKKRFHKCEPTNARDAAEHLFKLRISFDYRPRITLLLIVEHESNVLEGIIEISEAALEFFGGLTRAFRNAQSTETIYLTFIGIISQSNF